MARLANSAAHLYQRLQELYPHKLHLHNDQSEQTSPFRRWTTGNGAGSSYRHHDHRNIYNKQMSEPLKPESSGGVSRWALGLEYLLADPAGAAAFAQFLKEEFAYENIRFWWACEQYAASPPEERAAIVRHVHARHLADTAPEPVNVDAGARRAAAVGLGVDVPSADLLLAAQKQIFNLMKFDSYPRFLRSNIHADCVRAGLQGVPHPYMNTNKDLKAQQVKKSSSSVSERRRSGGSLLPWKTKNASKDRTQEPPQETTQNDVVTSHALGSLCRLVLPDGATSVVGVTSETVRELVDRLLARRRIECRDYDVLMEDGEKHVVIPGSSLATMLGGRAARVERRCVVRVQLGARVLALRARPARPVHQALRPVLGRCGGVAGRVTVTLAGRPLSPTRRMQDVDGLRIHVHVEPDLSDVTTDVRDVTDAPLTPLELQDLVEDDEDSQNTDSRNTDNGRVRASLRPGAALHHPPDFLENLRETQRIRLNKDMMDTRSPPPLPPKPRHTTHTAII